MPNGSQDDIFVHGEHEYRCQGGEVHRRPVDRDDVSPFYAAWLVVHGTNIPNAVKRRFFDKIRLPVSAAA